MQLSTDVPPKVLTAVVALAARHRTSVSILVAQAVVEYLMDVDAGLLAPPRPAARWELRVRRKAGE